MHCTPSQTLEPDWTLFAHWFSCSYCFLSYHILETRLCKKIWTVVQSDVATVSCLEQVVQAAPSRHRIAVPFWQFKNTVWCSSGFPGVPWGTLAHSLGTMVLSLCISCFLCLNTSQSSFSVLILQLQARIWWLLEVFPEPWRLGLGGLSVHFVSTLSLIPLLYLFTCLPLFSLTLPHTGL